MLNRMDTIRRRIELGLLARTDALFMPFRRQSRRTTVEQYRWRFRNGGLPMGFEAGDRSDERLQLRLLHELAAQGRVILTRPKAGRSALVKLSEAADAEARRLAFYAGSLETGWMTVERLLAHEAECDCCHWDIGGRCWVRETVLGDCEWGSPDSVRSLLAVQALAMPALVRGWVVSNTSIEGHAFYRVTAAGRAAMETQPPAEPDPDEPADPAAAAFYRERLDAEYDRLDVLQPPKSSELGSIPLPVAYSTGRPASRPMAVGASR